MPATVKVFTRTASYVANVPTVVETEVYAGPARVQPVRSPRRNPEVGDTRVDQTVNFQIVLTGVELKADTMFVRVTSCPLNPALVNNQVYTLSAVIGGSNPIETTFSAVVDTSG